MADDAHVLKRPHPGGPGGEMRPRLRLRRPGSMWLNVILRLRDSRILCAVSVFGRGHSQGLLEQVLEGAARTETGFLRNGLYGDLVTGGQQFAGVADAFSGQPGSD